jgi:hypothetical protein
MEQIHLDPIPDIYCALEVICPAPSPSDGFEDQLNQIMGTPIVPTKSFDGELFYTLAETGNVPSWDLTDILNQMFAMLNGKLSDLKQLVRSYGYSFYVDVAFYHHGTYPTLNFSGEAMKNIIFLEADISIDPY